MTPLLHHGERHETLHDIPWDAARVHQGLADIVSDIEAAPRSPAGAWPVHARDAEPGDPPGGFHGLYLGQAGVRWALWWLQRQGAVSLAEDPARDIAAVHAAYLAAPDTGRVEPSHFMGEAGILLAWWRLTGSVEAAERLHAVVRANLDHPSNEAFVGAPGTLLAAAHLWRATGQPRWRELLMHNADTVWQTWQRDEAAQCHLWTQLLYGKTVQYLGAGHGWAGNVFALLQAAELLEDDRRRELQRRCEHALATLARRDGAAVNWPPGTYVPRPNGPRMLMQWCHGAPGLVTSLAGGFAPGVSPVIDELLLAGGQAIWQAGPLAKGAGLCHGSSGNALALLALHGRDAHGPWLARARAFAMHALAQRERERAAHPGPRATLWTGDAGLAVALWQCLQGRAGMPTLDFID